MLQPDRSSEYENYDDIKREMPTVKDLFAKAANEVTGYADPEEYYYKEFESALDHMEIESQSDFAWKFFTAGIEAAKRLQ